MPLVSGVVKSQDGRPVANAMVSFVQAPVAVPEIALLTGEDGSFQLNAPSPGTYVMGANHPEEGAGQQQTVVGAEGATPIEIHLQREE
jgi:hypothetical protein